MGACLAQLVLVVASASLALAFAVLGVSTGNVPALAASVGLAPLSAIVFCRLLARRMVEALKLALTDPLTGLGNVRHFYERLERVLDRAEACGEPVALVLLDVDGFKGVNDRFGHPTGDDVLAELAGCLRHGGEAFRLGGDEFALLLAGKAEPEALRVAESVLARIRAARYPHGGGVSASAGVATYPAAGVERGTLVRAADAALYRAKRAGKDQAHAFRPSAEPSQEAPAQTEADRLALLQAAASLATAAAAGVEGHDGRRVDEIAARIAARMGLGAE